ncbi:cupin domain-containing protein [Coralloluteibacterium stylophorae]|uniref:Cupin domain-containing protein n=1 Tax=Coralloluteibacterium stylophorae TaxID=1776034 RepID=A0A8J7VRN1_9GAMM|nr:cupin domain-containing protein [Coralloluteibacterium stylophorae]MBS7457000.1 cupin domain-containing protein [Coralloluteibacterium stylophorae]
MQPEVRALVDALGLEPHPEGGHYRRIHAAAEEVVHNGRRRPAQTVVQFLLAAGERSRWHRVDADETWQWRAGDALALEVFDPVSGQATRMVLGAPDAAAVHTVPAGHWQTARPLGSHALCTCTVAPGFVWEGFELLEDGATPPGWHPASTSFRPSAATRSAPR